MPSISLNQSSKKTNAATLVLIVAVLIVGAAVGFLMLSRNSPSLSPVRRASEPTSAPAAFVPTKAVTTSPQLCPIDGATCSWSAVKDASGYAFTITDLTTGETIKEGVVPGLSVVFTPQVKHTYRCSVKAVNSCGEGPKAQAENTCEAQPTPTPTTTPPTSQTPTPTATPGVGTPTATPTATLTPSTANTATPTPTKIVAQSTSTPVPTALPKAGLFTPSILIVIIALSIIAMGFVL